jgi:hypothetical protein
MRDFEVVIPTSRIRDWRSLNTPTRKIGGLLVVSIHVRGQDLTGLKIFPVYWEDVLDNFDNEIQMIVGEYVVPLGTDDFVLLDTLRSSRIGNQTNSQNPDILNWIEISEREMNFINSPIGSRELTTEFELAFLDIDICEFLSEKNKYYYYSNPSNPFLFFADEDMFIEVDPFNRGIEISRSITELTESTESNVVNSIKYRTIISRPYPNPILSGRVSAAIAYMLHPTCPPTWKNNSFLQIMLPSAFSKLKELEKPIKIVPPREPFPWYKFFLVIIGALLTLLIQKIM